MFSSAAFICATAENYKMAQQDLTRITVLAQHCLGIINDGINQAASVCGKEGDALYVEFKPKLRATAFGFQQLRNYEMTFMIANTLVVAKKYETAPTNYSLSFEGYNR